jgi:hypothetical protein
VVVVEARIITLARESLVHPTVVRSPISSWLWQTTRTLNSAHSSTCRKRELFSKRVGHSFQTLLCRRPCAVRQGVRCSPVYSFTITES